MKPDFELRLGDFVFAGHEIPAAMPFGGEQVLVTHRLVGGVRVIDSMGRDDAPIEWSGYLTGTNALPRARYLKWLMNAGKPLALTWSELSFTVLIARFEPVMERAYQIPYRISCVVLADNALPVTTIADPGIDASLAEDLVAAKTAAAEVGDAQLTQSVGALDKAIAAVSSFAKATTATINSVLTPIAAVQQRVQILVASTANALGNAATLGGVLPGNPISRQVAALSSQAAAAQQLPALLRIRAATSRMGVNLGAINGGRQVAVAGGTLYDVAARQYGDATAWTGIARANRLDDPKISEVRVLTVPGVPDASGGVIGA